MPLEEVPEELQKFYEETGTGAFVLSIDGVPPQAQAKIAEFWKTTSLPSKTEGRARREAKGLRGARPRSSQRGHDQASHS